MPNGIDNQPLNKIEWVDRERLHANGYNPNHVSPKEMRLLKISILEDGWTQPIVARTDGEIVDGFHRWTTSSDKEVSAMTGGKVPVVYLNVSMEHQMMSTIRHNRARGNHGVLKMADIVCHLVDNEKLSFEEVGKRLQMEEEEVDRLYDQSGMLVRGSKEGFNTGWVPSDDV
ncbi:Chromosome segregation protein Spo0J, contains ParB-like nuclease domain [Priestia aryabhattai B8W22]|uniref:IbrB-like domain-containing protein n=1 Tax=Priestia aryabhattai TaxID=412384 RepID=UPI00088F9D0F|nr:Chromosome segregation protein Spo0J, contains ParB-like nuclease domain [Priestia aryabhattai B8W22]